MKRCPECRRDYYDDSLSYCLDDGSALVEGPPSAEVPTALFGKRDLKKGDSRSWRSLSVRSLVLATGVLLIAGGGYWFFRGTPGGKTGPSPPGYDNYMRAKVLLASENKVDDDDAIQVLEETVKNEPQYAAAWAELARGYNIRSFYFASSDEERRQLNQSA